jgi:hypothetical protein
MSSVAVLIPWAGKCPHRRAALGYVRTWYGEHHPNWQIAVGRSKVGSQWCKAKAVADALRQTAAEILVIADADCLTPGVGEAVEQAEEGSPWAMPHYKVHRLNQSATARVLAGETPEKVTAGRRVYTQSPYVGYAGGGVVVVRRDVYLSAPLDPRYLGWGQEDESWADALSLLYGEPWRSKLPLWHLWHPPQQRMTRVTGSHESRELRKQYRRVTTIRGMERLLKPAIQLAKASLPERNSV